MHLRTLTAFRILKGVSSDAFARSYVLKRRDFVTAFSALRKSPQEFTEEMKNAAVVKWYENGLISQNKASEILGLSRYAFMCLLTQYKVSVIQYSPDDLDKELHHAHNENRS